MAAFPAAEMTAFPDISAESCLLHTSWSDIHMVAENWDGFNFNLHTPKRWAISSHAHGIIKKLHKAKYDYEAESWITQNFRGL